MSLKDFLMIGCRSVLFNYDKTFGRPLYNNFFKESSEERIYYASLYIICVCVIQN